MGGATGAAGGAGRVATEAAPPGGATRCGASALSACPAAGSAGGCDPKNLRRIIAYLLAFIFDRFRFRPLMASAIAFCSSGDSPMSDSPSSTVFA